ncbi:MAG: ABC transporter substrate-binding protein [Deferrisomatales bacterium]|nr:ABC transporter substrate-binding protein [Deferrisomatales bacterium]
MTRRSALGLLGLSGAGMLLRFPVPVFASDPLRLGVDAASLGSWPLLVAADRGYLKDEGLAFRLVPFADEVAMAGALAAGELDVGILPTPRFLALHVGAQGPRRPLVTFQVSLTDGSALVVPAASELRYSRQLRGKTIGTPQPLGMARFLTGVYLVLSGLTPGPHVRLQDVDPQDALAALRAGRIDALAAEAGLFAEAVERGEVRVMDSLHKVWTGHPAELIAVGRDLWEARPDTVAALARASLRGARDLIAFSPRLPDSLTARLGTSAPALVKAAEVTRAGFDPFPYRSAMDLALRELVTRGVIPPAVDQDAVLAEAFLPDLCRRTMHEVGYPEVPDGNDRDERLVGCCYVY